MEIVRILGVVKKILVPQVVLRKEIRADIAIVVIVKYLAMEL